MIKQVLNSMDYSTVAEIALVLFFLAFALATLHTLLRSKKEVLEAAQLPLEDGESRKGI